MLATDSIQEGCVVAYHLTVELAFEKYKIPTVPKSIISKNGGRKHENGSDGAIGK